METEKDNFVETQKKEKQVNDKLDRKFDTIIDKLKSGDCDEYAVSDLFDKALDLVKPDAVDCDTFTPLADNNVENGEELIDTYEEDIGNLEAVGCTKGKPTEAQAEKAGEVGREPIEDREQHLAFVNDNFISGLNWYQFTNDDRTHLEVLTADSALTLVRAIKEDAYILL